ncbi:MAG: hypothetical protein H6656_04400 [Ardenticatenaceae bacterium]|nr:hypothetical protein [Ardenticatenaceae bacterium]
MIRIGMAVFLAATLMHLLLDVLQVQAAAEQPSFSVLPAQIQVSTSPEWFNDCVPQKTLVAGIGLGTAEQLINPQTLVWPYAGELVTMQAQVAGIITNEPLPEAVAFSTSSAEQVTATETITDEVAYYLAAAMQPALAVTSTLFFPLEPHQTAVSPQPVPINNLSPKGSGPRGLVLYGQVMQPDLWRSVGRLTLASVSAQRDAEESHEEVLAFPPLAAETELVVTAVSIDNDADDRAILIEAAAGGVVAAVTETGPTNGDILNITTLTLTAVPTGTSQLSLTIKSPPSPVGDSATLIGLNLNYPCSSVDTSNSVDLIIDQVGFPPVAQMNTAVSASVRVTNTSQLTASNVVVINSVQTSGSLSADSPQVNCTAPDDANVCQLGDLEPGETEGFTIWLTPTSPGVVTVTAVATSDQPDPTPNIATTTLVVTDFTNAFYVPMVLKPHIVDVIVKHSQNPAINNIPYKYFITVTNKGNRNVPRLIIQDEFSKKLLVEAITPPAGCNGAVQPPYDLLVYCEDGLAAGGTLTFSVQVRPNISSPQTIQANIKVSTLEPDLIFFNNLQVTPTAIDMCLNNSPGLGNAYGPLLIGETYCGQTMAQKDAKYYFTFTLTNPGRIVAVVRPTQVSWVPSSINFPALTQMALMTTDGTAYADWCCPTRSQDVKTEAVYLVAGEKLLLVKSLESFGYTYTINLEYYPLAMVSTAVLPSAILKEPSNLRLLGSAVTNHDIRHTGWQTAVFFVGFMGVAFSLVYRQRKRNV